MPATRSESISDFYKKLVGQAVTVHLLNGETVNGTVLDVDSGDLLLARTGYDDLVYVPKHGLAAITAGSGAGPGGARTDTTVEGASEALPLE